MCYYVLQETVCGVPGCACIFLAIVYRGLCDDRKEPTNSIDLCRGGNAFWFWTQGSFTGDGSLPQGCCAPCRGPDHVELMPPKINIQTAPKIENWPQQDYEENNAWVTQIPFNAPTGNDLDSFARHKLAYQKACFGSLPSMSWIWHDQIDQADVDREAQRIHESVQTGDFLEGEKEAEEPCPILDRIEELDAMFEPSLVVRDDRRAAGQIDEELVIFDADTPAVQ